MQRVSVLGTFYTIKYSNEVEDKGLKGFDGYCDFNTKTIVIDGTNSHSVIETTTRHEVIHAFLFESGLDSSSWARNEEIVDWFANQFPKLDKVFDELKV